MAAQRNSGQPYSPQTQMPTYAALETEVEHLRYVKACLLHAATELAQAIQPIQGPRTWRDYKGETFYVVSARERLGAINALAHASQLCAEAGYAAAAPHTVPLMPQSVRPSNGPLGDSFRR